MNPSFARRVALSECLHTLDSHKQAKIGVDEPQRRAQKIMHPYLAVGLERYDRTAAAVAIEPRHPFLDLAVVNLCLRLPVGQVAAGGWHKAILRRAMAHYSSKQRVLATDGHEMNHQPMPIGALYVLAPPDAESDAISVSRLSARETCIEIVRNSFQLDVTDHQRAIQLLDAASEVAQHLPAFRLTYPRDHALLPQVRTAILAQQGSWAGANVDILAGQ